MQNSSLYEFDEFRLDVGKSILTKGGERLQITPKPFLLLKTLVENHGRIVGKNELMEKVWGETFVEESNLTYTIRQLRKILDDDIHQPKFIETVSRQGYRFVAEVLEIEKLSNVVEEVNENETKEEGKYLKTRNWANSGVFRIILPLTLVFGIVFFLFIVQAFTSKKIVSPILENPFQNETLALTKSPIGRAAISPDGKYAAYPIGIGDKESLWIKELETGNNVEIIPPSECFYYGVFFTHKGDHLYVAKKKKNETSIILVKVSILGGMQITVLDDVQGSNGISPDDKNLSFVDYAHKPDDYSALWIADSDGQNRRKLVSRPENIDMTDNEWTKDGKSIIFAYGKADNASQNYSVAEVDVETGQERVILKDKFFHIKQFATLNDNEHFLMTAILKVDEPSKIWLVSRETGEFTPLTKTNDSYRTLSLSNDETKLITTTHNKELKINLVKTEDFSDSRILTDGGTNDFTPDGNIIYASDISGNGDIWSMKPDGSGRKQLTVDKNRDWEPHSSANGKYIFFASNRSGEEQVWRMNRDGSEQRQITENEGGYPIGTDEKFVYYTSASKRTLRKVSVSGGEESLVLEKKNHLYTISKDNTKVAYFEKNENKYAVAIFSLTENREVVSIPLNVAGEIADFGWSADDSAIYFLLREKKDELSLWRQPLHGGEPRKTIDSLKPDAYGYKGLSFSSDGQYFTYVSGGFIHNTLLVKGLK